MSSSSGPEDGKGTDRRNAASGTDKIWHLPIFLSEDVIRVIFEFLLKKLSNFMHKASMGKHKLTFHFFRYVQNLDRRWENFHAY